MKSIESAMRRWRKFYAEQAGSDRLVSDRIGVGRGFYQEFPFCKKKSKAPLDFKKNIW